MLFAPAKLPHGTCEVSMNQLWFGWRRPDVISLACAGTNQQRLASPQQLAATPRSCHRPGTSHSFSTDPSTPPGQVPISNNGVTDASQLDGAAGPRPAGPAIDAALLASTARFRPAPQIASDKWSASPRSPEQPSAAPAATPMDDFPGLPLPIIVPYSVSAR